jgi:hypothetical protein
MLTEIGSVRVPVIRSAAAKFTISQLNGVRRFLFGSNTTDRIMRIFPRTFKKHRIRQTQVVITANASGIPDNGQFFSKCSLTKCIVLQNIDNTV